MSDFKDDGLKPEEREVNEILNNANLQIEGIEEQINNLPSGKRTPLLTPAGAPNIQSGLTEHKLRQAQEAIKRNARTASEKVIEGSDKQTRQDVLQTIYAWENPERVSMDLQERKKEEKEIYHSEEVMLDVKHEHRIKEEVLMEKEEPEVYSMSDSFFDTLKYNRLDEIDLTMDKDDVERDLEPDIDRD